MIPPLRSLACPCCRMVQVVPADSPRGPELRLRCLACHASLSGSEEITRMTGGLQVSAAPRHSHWYLVDEGQVCGPIDREDVIARHARGSIDDDALVWHLGFTAWARLSNTATFSAMVGGRRPAPRREHPTVQDLTAHASLIDAEPISGRPRGPTAPRRRAPSPLRGRPAGRVPPPIPAGA